MLSGNIKLRADQMDENYLISRRERKMKLWLLHCAFSDPHTKRFVYAHIFQQPIQASPPHIRNSAKCNFNFHTTFEVLYILRSTSWAALYINMHLVAHSSCASCLVVQCLSWVSLGVNQIFKWRCVCALTLNSLNGSAALLYMQASKCKVGIKI